MHAIKRSSFLLARIPLRKSFLTGRSGFLGFSTSANHREVESKESYYSINSWVQRLNRTTASHPNVSVYFFLALRMTSWYALTAIYSLIGTFGPELAVGYLVTKFSGKFRQPANAALAGVISSTFPSLQKINSSALVGIIHHPPPANNSVTPSSSSLRKGKAGVELSAALAATVEKLLNWIKGPLDKFGFSYFLASKVNIIITLCGTAAAIDYGVDLSSLLSALGISESLQSGAGAMAAATLTNICLLPAHLIALTVYSPKIAEVISKAANAAQEASQHNP